MKDIEEELEIEELVYEDEEDETPEVEAPEEDAVLRYESGKTYTNWELAELTDQFLRADSRRELCRKCQEYGDPTGEVESQPQFEAGKPLLDSEDNQLFVDFPELECKNKHRWYKGEGKARGNGGKNPILFEEHLKNRQRREIYNSLGVPDPGIVSGLYNRTHPQGRKVNSQEARDKHGAAFYR